MATSALILTLTLIGGPTLLIEVNGVRLLTDPTFDPAGTRYEQGPVRFEKLAGPALLPEQLGPIDAVLLSHDTHVDNLDHAGRTLLPRAGVVLTTPGGAERLGGNAQGLAPWQSITVKGVKVTAVPARHGPEGSEPFLGEVTGFVIEAGGEALYISGDTRSFTGLGEIGRRFQVGVAVLHAGDAHVPEAGPERLTLDATEAAQVLRTVGARTLVPVHLDGWSHLHQGASAFERAWEAVGAPGTLELLQPGRRTRVPVRPQAHRPEQR
jgi:L-ascorbate metabolism protein UlaG (beta-lactamase superfamily)